MAEKRSQEAQRGTPRAFEEYYDAWSGPVYRYLVHLVGPHDMAEDLFQETWMKALEHRDQLESPDRFGSWILRIARNLAFNAMRGRRRKVQVWVLGDLVSSDGQDRDNLAERQASDDPSPRDSAIRAQRRAIVQKAIAELDLQTQEMLQLRYFEHLTLAEVAAVLAVPLGTVCTKVHRALKAIRQRLERQGYSGLHEI